MWTLKVIRGSELAEKLVPQMRLPQPLQCFTIGRDATNQWSIADRARAISARHCEIFDTPRGPALRDVSTNGTFVNGALTRLEGEHLVREGDEDFQARADGPAWWRLVVRHGQLAGGLYVGPPGSAKAFTKLLQQPLDLAPLREELRAGSLEGLKRLAHA